MEKFAFIVHPIEIRDVARKFPFADRLSDRTVEYLARYIPPLKVSHISGIRSNTGAEAEGWFVGVSLTPKLMLELDLSLVMKRIIGAGRIAEKLGAGIVGLGAFTSVVGDAGITVDKNLDIAVTTGNSYTVATALQGVKYACDRMGKDLGQSAVAILGATGSIGSASARILATQVGALYLVARNPDRLAALKETIQASTANDVKIFTDTREAVRAADVIVTVTSALEELVYPEDLRPGAIVCDVARPRNVSRSVAEKRNDVLVFEGGVVEVPGNVDFGFNFGFPPQTSYACMAETMILALEGRYESFSLGRDMEVAKILEIERLAQKHGFRLAGLRSFERAVTDDYIDRVKQNASDRKKGKLEPGFVSVP